jgi:xanthine dehydrogenase YagT iron-sulfur-binding subunit
LNKLTALSREHLIDFDDAYVGGGDHHRNMALKQAMHLVGGGAGALLGRWWMTASAMRSFARWARPSSWARLMRTPLKGVYMDDKLAVETRESISASLPAKSSVTLRVNGAEQRLEMAPWTTLLDALREYLYLTGTKKGCDHGQCGACTVLVNGRRINSCLTLAIMQDGAEVTTIEGLAKGEALHPLQQAFVDHDAFQCGYCTPGQICSGVGLIAEGKAKTADDIRELMSGNICRCGAYPNIVAAVEEAMRATDRRAER